MSDDVAGITKRAAQAGPSGTTEPCAMRGADDRHRAEATFSPPPPSSSACEE